MKPSPQQAYSFLFLESALDASDAAEETLFRAVLASDITGQATFEFRRGGLLLYTLAYRPTSIVAEPTPPGARFKKGASVTQTGDKDLYMTLIYDFCDAIRWEWHTELFPPEDLPWIIGKEKVHVLSV